MIFLLSLWVTRIRTTLWHSASQFPEESTQGKMTVVSPSRKTSTSSSTFCTWGWHLSSRYRSRKMDLSRGEFWMNSVSLKQMENVSIRYTPLCAARDVLCSLSICSAVMRWSSGIGTEDKVRWLIWETNSETTSESRAPISLRILKQLDHDRM